MSDKHSKSPARDDLEKTLACVGRVTREFDRMTGRLQKDNAEIAMLSEELRQLGNRSPANRRSVTLPATAFHEIDQSLARQKALGMEMVEAAATFARELVKWAEEIEKRERRQAPGLSTSPSIPIVTGGNGLMPDEFGDSALPETPMARRENVATEDAVPGGSRGTQESPTPAPSQSLSSSSSEPKAHAQTLPTPHPLITVTGVPSDAGLFLYNGQDIQVPPNADFIAVYDAGAASGLLNINEINAGIGHFGTFDYQRNRGMGWAGESLSANYFYPAYTDASNFAVGVFMAGAGYHWLAINDVASTYADLASGGKISPNARPMWKAGWDYGQEIKASRALNPAPLAPEDINPFFPIEKSQ